VLEPDCPGEGVSGKRCLESFRAHIFAAAGFAEVSKPSLRGVVMQIDF
jgi:hypothetical protein